MPGTLFNTKMRNTSDMSAEDHRGRIVGRTLDVQSKYGLRNRFILSRVVVMSISHWKLF